MRGVPGGMALARVWTFEIVAPKKKAPGPQAEPLQISSLALVAAFPSFHW